jgi:Na+-translocating ferredoxin:NAD+ oxidoreductase RnfC subunit
VTGAVKEPKSFWVPIGTTFRDVLGQAGGTTVSEFGLFVSGLMMGTLTFDLDDAVTKTTAGLIVLPRDHYLVTRKDRSVESMNRIGKSACDQCSYCTEFCPRYLLGYEIEPHKVMRSLGFTATGKDNWNQWAELCCACGLCTLYACPEDLYPKEACDGAKADMGSAGIKFVQEKPVRVHPMKEHRRVPLSLLRKRMKVEEYERDAPFQDLAVAPAVVRIKLKQHTGAPAKPVLRPGGRVGHGDPVATVEPSELGANIHASIDGTVKAITDTYIEIEA